MKCGYCGKNIKDNAKFCTYCGHNLIEIQPDEQPAPSTKGGYLSSLLTLLAIIIILGAGGAYMLKGGGQSNAISASDASAKSYDTEGAAFDEALFGQWSCTDRAAADYSPSDYGIDVNILLEMTNKGKFTLHYSMTDTGAPALKLKLNGAYSVKNGTVTFKPDLSNVSGEISGNYFKNHGNTPSFAYTVTDSTLTLKYENGTDIIFTRQS